MKNTIVKNYLLIAAMGFFSILAQTLLFRTFLIAFDGNELSIGLFFFSWLFWICIGAYVAKLKIFTTKYFPLLLLLYIPFFVLQCFAFIYAQDILGGNFFEIISIHKIIIFSLLFNAPVSFITGILFVGAVNWINLNKTISVPVIKVYMCEALGSFLGALIVTVLLYFAVIEEYVFLVGILVIILAVALNIAEYKSKCLKVIFCIFVVIIIGLFFTGLPESLNNYTSKQQWNDFINGGNNCKSGCEKLDETPAACYNECAGEEFFIVCDYICEDASDSELAGCYKACSGKSFNIMCGLSCWDD